LISSEISLPSFIYSKGKPVPFVPPQDRARIRADFEFEGVTYKAGAWLTGHLAWAGHDTLKFDSNGILFVPDYFDRFDLEATTFKETLSVDLGRALDRDDDDYTYEKLNDGDEEDDSEEF
jgi:hypothetical protein